MSRAAFEPVFVVDDAPHLRPLAAVLGESASALVAFVDGERARLIPLTSEGVGEEVALASAVPGHHRRGGWAQLARQYADAHRSISPNTMSNEPISADMSASMCLRPNGSSACKEANPGARILQR